MRLHQRLLTDLTIDQLNGIAEEFDLVVPRGPKAAIIATLVQSDISAEAVFTVSRFSKDDLEKICNKLGIPRDGRKQVLCERILQHCQTLRASEVSTLEEAPIAPAGSGFATETASSGFACAPPNSGFASENSASGFATDASASGFANAQGGSGFAAGAVDSSQNGMRFTLVDLDGKTQVLENETIFPEQGAMGVVSLAQWLPHGNRTGSVSQVVIKRLSREFAADANRLRLFRNEAMMSLKYGGENIVKGLFEGTDDQGRPYYVMDYVPGETLAKVIETQDSEARKLAFRKIALGILHALRKLHSNGILHRDLKPANILIKADHTPVIIDLGLASKDNMEDLANVTKIGTDGYMAPELQATPASHPSYASDLYSFGIICLEILTGSKDVQKLSQIPAPYQHLIGQCLKAQPMERLQNVDDALDALSQTMKNIDPRQREEIERKVADFFADDGVLDASERAILENIAQRNGLPSEELNLLIQFAEDRIHKLHARIARSLISKGISDKQLAAEGHECRVSPERLAEWKAEISDRLKRAARLLDHQCRIHSGKLDLSRNLDGDLEQLLEGLNLQAAELELLGKAAEERYQLARKGLEGFQSLVAQTLTKHEDVNDSACQELLDKAKQMRIVAEEAQGILDAHKRLLAKKNSRDVGIGLVFLAVLFAVVGGVGYVYWPHVKALLIAGLFITLLIIVLKGLMQAHWFIGTILAIFIIKMGWDYTDHYWPGHSADSGLAPLEVEIIGDSTAHPLLLVKKGLPSDEIWVTFDESDPSDDDNGNRVAYQDSMPIASSGVVNVWRESGEWFIDPEAAVHANVWVHVPEKRVDATQKTRKRTKKSILQLIESRSNDLATLISGIPEVEGSGKLIIRLTILPDGQVDRAEVVSSETQNVQFDQLVCETIKNWAFEAGPYTISTTDVPLDI